MNPLSTIADTLDARADADDPLAPAEMRALAATLRSEAARMRTLTEWADEAAESSRLLMQGTSVVRWRPGGARLAVVQGGRG